MKVRTLVACGFAVLSMIPSTSAFAANASVAGIVARFFGPFEIIKIPVVGTLGNASLGALPVLGSLPLPLLGKGIPVVSSITVTEGATILQSLSPLQSLTLVHGQ